MIELGQLERRHEDFARQATRVVVASLESTEDAARTQADFSHLLVLADHGQGLAKAVEVIHPHTGPAGSDTSAPTTILIDRDGTVRWLFRSRSVNVRLSPDELLDAIRTHF